MLPLVFISIPDTSIHSWGWKRGRGADGEGVETDLEEVAAGEVVAETGEGGAAGAERRERSFGKKQMAWEK